MSQPKWKVESISLNELMEYPSNARQMSEEQNKQLEKSVNKYGLCQPLVANKNLTLIGGHQRLRVLLSHGETHANVMIPDRLLTNEEVAELNIKLNKISGDWDWDELANKWDPADLIDWGFTEQEMHLAEEDDYARAYNEDGTDKEEKKVSYIITLQFDSKETRDSLLEELERQYENHPNAVIRKSTRKKK